MEPTRLRLLCGLEALAGDTRRGLEQHGFTVDPDALFGLLVDAPWTWAAHRLQTLKANEWVVLTDNPCPEYWDDLWEQKPRALLAGGSNLAEIVRQLRRAETGERFRNTPYHETPLTHTERLVLRRSARGWSNKRIAASLECGERTVKSHLGEVYRKLNLKGREQAMLYYAGLWHWLEGHE